MVRGLNKQGFFYVAEKQYRIRSAWLVPDSFRMRPLSGRIEKVENPFRALRSQPDTIEVAIDVGIEERSLVEWACRDGKTYRDGKRFYGPADVQCPEGHRVVVAYRHNYTQPHPAEFVSEPVIVEGPAPLPDDWQPS